jgi:hypothetical protein
LGLSLKDEKCTRSVCKLLEKKKRGFQTAGGDGWRLGDRRTGTGKMKATERVVVGRRIAKPALPTGSCFNGATRPY